MKYKLGVIGAGNMAQAIFKGAISKEILKPDDIAIYDIQQSKAEVLSSYCGVAKADTIKQLADESEILLLAVKPNVAESVLTQLDFDDKAVLSIVTGLSYERMEKVAPGKNLRFLRIVPNTPLMVGYGATAFATPCTLSEDELAFAKNLFSALGTVDYIDEGYMHAVTSISGSGPAYVYMFIEALADAGVQQGLPRDVSLALAVQTIEGGAQMVRGTGKHPASLRDEVCSPGGTTIEAVSMLEKKGFRSAIFEAVQVCADKAKKL